MMEIFTTDFSASGTIVLTIGMHLLLLLFGVEAKLLWHRSEWVRTVVAQLRLFGFDGISTFIGY